MDQRFDSIVETCLRLKIHLRLTDELRDQSRRRAHPERWAARINPHDRADHPATVHLVVNGYLARS